MGTEWIITGFTLLPSAGGAACTLIPHSDPGGIGYFLYRRYQQSSAFRQAAQ